MRVWELVNKGAEWSTGNAYLVAYLKQCGYQETEHVEGSQDNPFVTFRFAADAKRRLADGIERTIDEDRADWQMKRGEAAELRKYADTLRDVTRRLRELKYAERGSKQ